MSYSIASADGEPVAITVERLIEAALVCASLYYIAVYCWIALHRLAYPFDVEWMEGAAVDHVARVLAMSIDGEAI